jgi:hypothetical protein
MQSVVELGKPARDLLAAQAEAALIEQQIATETRRRHWERLKTAPIEDIIEGEEDDVGDSEADNVGGTSETDDVVGAPAGPRILAHGEAVGFGRPDVERPSGAQGDGLAPAPRWGADSTSSSVPMACGHGPDSVGPAGASSAFAEATADMPATRSRRGASCTNDRAEPRGPREPRVPNIKFSPALLLTLALRAAKDLPDLSEKLRDLEAKLLPAEAELKLKQEFYLDRAVSIVTDTLNSMDEKFGKLGFGHWMPFRYIDQWLMFTGILNRVLAAHGLIPSGNAAIYRKLLDETDPISPACADAGPPKSYGLGYRVREFRTMKDMLARIEEVRAGRGPPL